MKKGLEMVSQSEYVTYIYESLEEERKHRKEMIAQGWHINGFLTNLKEGEKVYWKHKDVKYETYVDRS